MRNATTNKKWRGKRDFHIYFSFSVYLELSLFMIIAGTSSLIWGHSLSMSKNIAMNYDTMMEAKRSLSLSFSYQPPKKGFQSLLSNMTWHTADIYEFIEH